MRPAQYRIERTQRGLTQAALAALLGVPREAVVRREGGTQPISEEAAMALRAMPRSRRKAAPTIPAGGAGGKIFAKRKDCG